MEIEYYSEEIVKDTSERKEYHETLRAFVQSKKAWAEERRSKFISPKAYKADTEGYRQKFVEMLGFPLTESTEKPVCVRKEFVAQDKNVNIYRMQFIFSGILKTYGLYFEQVDKTDDTPFIIGLHGGQGTPEMVASMHLNSANYNHLVRRITDRGANVFAPQLLLWSLDTYGGEAYNRHGMDGWLRQLGGSMTAMELYWLRGCLDWFLENENVNADKLGVAGLSYGGMYALHLAAVEPRIKACYSCSYVNDLFCRYWVDWSYKNAQNTFTTAETMALVAPRALVVAMGDKDDLFPAQETLELSEAAAAYFEEFGKRENFKTCIFEGVHETDKSDEELKFLFAALEK